MEEACDEERRQKARKHQRNSSLGKISNSGAKKSTRRGLEKLDLLKQVIAADHISRSTIHITTANQKLQAGLAREVTTVSIPKLVQWWREGELVIEVVPRTQSKDGKEPPWRIEKYATLTRTLFEERIEAKEWEKLRRKLHITISDPSKITQESVQRKRDEVNMRVVENTQLHKDLAELDKFYTECRFSPQRKPGRAPASSEDRDFFSLTTSNSYNKNQ